MKRQIPGRLFATSLALFVCASSMYSPQSLIYAMTVAGGVPAVVCMYALAALALAAGADTLVNDVLSDRFRWRYGVRYRQGIWMLVATTYTGMAFVSSRHIDGWWLATYYLICAGHCISIAYIDLWSEHVDKLRNRRRGDPGSGFDELHA